MGSDGKSGSKSGKRAPVRPGGVDGAAIRVVDAMTDLLDLAAAELGFSDLDPAILDGVTVSVGHALKGEKSASDAAAEVARRAREIVRVAATGQDNWHRDRIFCLQCGSSNCIHSTPPSPTDIFAGYLPTGKPEWVDFTHFCMDRNIEGFETLFVQRPGVIAVSSRGMDLNSQLLDSFSDANYTVVGAVNAGLLPVDYEPTRAGGERMAVSFVAVAVLKGTALTIRLCRPGFDGEMMDHAAGRQGHRGPAERIRRLLSSTNARLEAVTLAIRHDTRISGPADVTALSGRIESAVMPVMNRLRSDLVNVFRGVDDRTKHGEHRLRSGSRPTSAAFSDAVAASDENLFFDGAENTIVVSGPRGRCHVFTPDGRLVTSIKLDPGELESRVSKKRWRPLQQTEITRFRQTLSKRR